MPIKHQLRRTISPTVTELTRRLHEEWNRPKSDGQPLIVILNKKPDPHHIYVIWDEWGDLSQQQRSEIILDVVENLAGESRLTWPVSVALGLTSEEAERMGIEPD